MEMELKFKFTTDNICWEGVDQDTFGSTMAMLVDIINTYCQSHYINIVEVE